ncbi:unnamed protein product [Effrenium voratum]|uniref:Uncharacterized protein n=1 Tax=Effrenium voratum TaxID=2562239 RepID=A0AA36N9R9_9DINO|nr:unnamed protein product [Effrenium voratum]CAJ1459527.1 unnamed protein product [Effrenium voratum]
MPRTADYGRDRAFRTFEGLFGDVHARWRPGLKVTGTFKSRGKKVTITIHPDGTTEEHEEVSRGGGYSSVTTIGEDGAQSNMQISLDLSQLAENFENPLLRWSVSILLPLLVCLCNPCCWCAGCGYYCCFRKSRTD